MDQCSVGMEVQKRCDGCTVHTGSNHAGYRYFTYSGAKIAKCPLREWILSLYLLCILMLRLSVHRADKYGNAQIDGITVSDSDVAEHPNA